MAGIELFKHGETVRFVAGLGTPSQKQCLWVVDLRGVKEDWGFNHVHVHRQSDPDCIIVARREMITASNLLDLMASL